MALKKGICKNIDGCDKAFNGEVQEVDSLNFVCEECGKELYPEGKGGSDGPSWWDLNKGKVFVGGGAVAVLAIIGCIIAFLFSGSPKPEIVALNKTASTLTVGQTETLVATVMPDGVEAELSWAAEGGVSVKDGVVTAVSEGEGKVVLTVKGAEGLSAECVYTVKAEEAANVDVEALKAEEASIAIAPTEKKQIALTATPENHNEKIAWSSSDEAVAIVSETGEVTALKDGSAVILAKSDRTGKTASVIVTVQKAKSGNGGQGSVGEGGGGSGSVSLGWGTYSGPKKNGKANGLGGTINVTKSYSIDMKNGSFVEVNPGDKIINVKIENNQLIQGQLKRADGTAKWLSIGV